MTNTELTLGSKPFCLFFQRKVLEFPQLIAYVEYCSSVAKSCLALCRSRYCSTLGFPVLHNLPEFAQTLVHWVTDAIQPSHPLLPPSPAFPSIRVFSNELALRIRWPKYWSFSFSISPSNEYLGLISFRITGLLSLLSKGLLTFFKFLNN